ncbi:MAG: hypothetical protein C6I00_05065 [Nitratiruptor sp.]|nr:hypothetical protein [Nitratiruptor sp.]NPA84281.1 hypothetical protein [Campylobacterota bacterium]
MTLPTRAFCAAILAASLFAQECKELAIEFRKLEELRSTIEAKIKRSKELLQQIQERRKALEELRQKIEQELQEIQKERYKRLAKDFEGMDPEMAGEKFSAMDPKIAAYILYNMSPRKAGEALNYIEAKVVAKITQILTQFQKNGNAKE